MSRSVVFSPEALGDLLDLYDHIATQGGAERAARYVSRIESFCRSLALFPERGARRDDVRAGLRLHGFERRAVIVFHVMADVVTIVSVLHGGRDVDRTMHGDPDPP